MRAFFAIGLDERAQAALSCARKAFCEVALSWGVEKWVSAENLHVTLLFLGDLPHQRLEALADRAQPIVASRPSFQMELGQAKAVPRLRAATMLWCTLERGAHEAGDVAGVLQDVASDFGVAPPARPFAAHVTLVRTRRPRPVPPDALAAAAEALAAHAPRTMSVHEIILCSSTLTRHGPVYSTLRRLPLAGD